MNGLDRVSSKLLDAIVTPGPVGRFADRLLETLVPRKRAYALCYEKRFNCCSCGCAIQFSCHDPVHNPIDYAYTCDAQWCCETYNPEDPWSCSGTYEVTRCCNQF